jgi:hypothetical protein
VLDVSCLTVLNFIPAAPLSIASVIVALGASAVGRLLCFTVFN